MMGPHPGDGTAPLGHLRPVAGFWLGRKRDAGQRAEEVEQHHAGSGPIVGAIASAFRAAGRDPEHASTADLATVDEMRTMLTAAGFELVAEHDSSDRSLEWFRAVAARTASGDTPPVTFETFLGADFAEMARNQVTNLADRRIRTVTFTCRR